MRLGFALLAVMIALGASAIDAFAVSERPKLTGFAGLRFYMTESEMQSAVPMVRSHENLGTVWFYGASPIDVAGLPFRLWAMLDGGIVRRIGASRLLPLQDSNCKAGFDAIVAHISSQFGPPDSSLQRGTKESYRARFEFEDHAVIEVMSGFSDHNMSCMDSIMHYAPSVPAQ